MSIGQKIEQVADLVYEKGKTDIISNSKYIEKQATGKVIRLDDVSEVPHKVKIKAGIEGKNWFDNDTSKIKRVYYTRNVGDQGTRLGYELIGLPAGEYTFTLKRINASVGAYISGVINDKEGNYTQPCALTPSGASNSTPLTININAGDIIYIYDAYPRTDDQISESIKAFESVQIHLECNSPEPAEVEVYGKNLCDGILEFGGISDSTGADITISTSIRTVNYIPVLPTTTYTISREDTTKNIRTRVYDKNKNFIGYVFTARTSPFTITTKDNHAFMRLELAGVNLEEKIQFEYGNYETEHEPYVGQTITATPEGTEVSSICPVMNIMADDDITVDYYGSYGMQTEWDRFWDACQNNGERSVYTYAFAYASWNDITFKPKYDIIIDVGNNAFSASSITDLAKILEEQGVSIKFTDSNGQKFNMFASSNITRIPVLTMPTNSTAYGYFSSCRKLHTVEGLVSNEITTYESAKGDSKTFAYCSELVKIIFYGIVANNCDIHWSTKLSRESILSLLKVLKASVTGVTITLPTKCIDTATDTKAMIEGDTELNTAYRQALANGYTISFQ
jgi:hypothetical protein